MDQDQKNKQKLCDRHLLPRLAHSIALLSLITAILIPEFLRHAQFPPFYCKLPFKCHTAVSLKRLRLFTTPRASIGSSSTSCVTDPISPGYLLITDKSSPTHTNGTINQNCDADDDSDGGDKSRILIKIFDGAYRLVDGDMLNLGKEDLHINYMRK